MGASAVNYFTPAWHCGDIEDDAAKIIQQDYWDFIRQIAPRLPPGVRCLAMETSLHDGRVRGITLHRQNEVLLLQLRCGDLAVGYFDLDLVFEQVELTPAHCVELTTAARKPKTEVLYHEIDIASNGKYILRLLFWPYREVEIQFSEVKLSHTPRSDRQIESVTNRFVVIG